MTTPEFDYIYCLKETESQVMFYIGRTEDPVRRIKEHRYGARVYKLGDEDKYMYAHALDELDTKWDMEVLMKCGPGTEFYEDYFVCKYRHEPLQNMRAGDSEPWMNRDHKSPEDFVQDRSQTIAAIAKKKMADKLAEKTRIKRDSDPAKTLFSFEDPNKKFVSPWYKERMARKALEKDIDGMGKAGFFGSKD